MPHKNNKERIEYFRSYRTKNREMLRDYYRQYRARPGYKERKRLVQAKFYVKLRLEVFQHYSGKEIPECACCGEKIFEFLTIDHINNDGGKMRKEKITPRGGNRFYCWLRINNYPENMKLQVLCYNCNCARAHLKECPHKQLGLYSALLSENPEWIKIQSKEQKSSEVVTLRH